MSRLTMGDCVHAGDRDKNGNVKLEAGQTFGKQRWYAKVDDNGNPQLYAERDSTSWDTQSYLYYMGHSVFNPIDAVQEANRLADVEAHRDPKT